MRGYSLLIIFMVLFCVGCKVNYSFSGASISPEVKTISIEYFANRAPLANPLTSQKLTETLKDLFISQTSLTLVKKQGDLQFEGEIIGYRTAPMAIQGNETAALNRLTITVSVRFKNQKDKKQNFESNFTRFADFASSENLTSVEEGLIEEINDQLVQDIFNKSVSNW